MRNLYKALGLLLLLLTAQQGAVVHELSHLTGANHSAIRAESGTAADTICELCPAFAQVVTPAFSHTFHIPLLVRTESSLCPEPRFVGIDATVPRPRSRGPPSLS
jgi:hypothetical protein